MIKNALNMIVNVFSRRYENYRIYLEGDSSHQTVMQSYDIFHTQHTIFFATLSTSASTM